MKHLKILAALCALSLPACAGGHVAGTVIPQGKTAHATLSITMHWPAIGTKSGVRAPKWISPSTRSVVVQVNASESYTTIANNPSAGAPVTSSLTVDAPPGNDTIAFLLYDATDGKGNILGQATVAQQITAGHVNTISAAIDGIVASVDLQPLPNQPWITTSTDASGVKQFAMKGDAGATFVATALDADGNVIVPEASAIAFRIDALTSTLTVSPVAGQPGQFTLHGSGRGTSSPVGLVAHASVGQTAIAQTNYTVSIAPLLYAIYRNGASSTLAAYDSTGTQVALPGTFSGITSAIGAAFDPKDHRFFVLDDSAHAILSFNSDGTAAGLPQIPAPAGTALAYDGGNGELYLLNNDGTVAAYNAADGSVAAAATTWSGANAPSGIDVYAADGFPPMIFIANAGNDTLTFYDEAGNPVGLGPRRNRSFDATLTPSAFAVDATSGNLYVAGSSAGTPTAAAIAVTGTPLASISAGLDSPVATAIDRGLHVLYVANATSGTIAAYDDALAGQLSTIAAPAGLSHPSTLTVVY